ncbi:MAG: hypothetical protein REI12_05295 [Pedobacter sp.]|nr:hypothetical protein [Pedobacter sp.]
MTTQPHSGYSTRRQNFWLCCLLLACLVGLQVHAPSHALGQALNQGGETALLPWDNSADSHAGQNNAHGHSPVSDCCPAGLLAVSHSSPAPAAYPLSQPSLHSSPHFLTDSPSVAPYQSRAPPV